MYDSIRSSDPSRSSPKSMPPCSAKALSNKGPRMVPDDMEGDEGEGTKEPDNMKTT